MTNLIINRSDQQLNTDEIHLVNKGLNFAIAPRHIPTLEIKTCLEDLAKRLLILSTENKNKKTTENNQQKEDNFDNFIDIHQPNFPGKIKN